VACRVRVVADPGLRDRQCRLDVSLADGRVLSAGLDGPVGRPDFAAIADFARRLAPEMEATREAVERLVGEVEAIETRRTLRPLVASIVALGPMAAPAGRAPR
jgi:hypothetical protein